MQLRAMQTLANGSALALVMVLGGCGGGSGGGVTSTPAPPVSVAPAPTPVPTPTPTPTPPPTSTLNFNTSEARRTDSFAFHGALTAYNQNVTGQGVTVGIIDSGIDSDSPEFTGRIHPQSFDAAGTRTIDGDGSHGTQVAQVLGGSKNDTGTFGIAFGATLLVIRADRPGSCTATSSDPDNDGCRYPESAIADGLDRAIVARAKVVNISLGGGSSPGFTLRQAVARATAAGIIVIVSAGNEGDTTEDGNDPNNPALFAQGLRDAGGGLVIIVGSSDEKSAISDFSNRAGGYAESYLTALGDSVCCEYENGALKTETTAEGTFVFLLNGTSFAAPQVAGAIALVTQAFPTLTPQQIVALLYQSARDVGATGTDAIFGRGILDIARAFAPVGSTSLAGTKTAISLGSPLGSLSAPMGDAQGSAIGVLTDGFGRAFDVDLGAGLAARRPTLRLLPALDQAVFGRVAARGPTALSLTFAPNSGTWSADQSATNLFSAHGARALAASMVTRIGARDRVGFAAQRSLSGVIAGERGLTDHGMLLASRGGDALTPLLDPGTAALWRHDVARWGQISLLAETGWVGGQSVESDPRRRFAALRDSRYQRVGIGWDRHFGGLGLALTASQTREEASLLGARFGPLFGAGGSTSRDIQASATLALPGGWSLAGEWTGVRAQPDRAGLISGGALKAMAWSIDAARAGVIVPGDRIALRYAQPLRIVGGALNLDLPIAHDALSETTRFGTRALTLTPSGQERVAELGYQMRLGNVALSLNSWWRRDPGHFAALNDDLGGAIRFTLGY